jgi:hypothetical protein
LNLVLVLLLSLPNPALFTTLGPEVTFFEVSGDYADR